MEEQEIERLKKEHLELQLMYEVIKEVSSSRVTMA